MNLKLTTLLCATLFLGTAASAQKLEYEKWGKGINFATGDGLSTIKMSARIQNLFIYNQVLTPSGSSPTVQGMTRRARLKFDGQAFSPRIKYKIELGLSNRDTKYSDDANLVGGNARIILDAVVKYEVAKGTQLWFGQTKLPGNRERVVSSQKLQFVDRSNVNSKFNIDRDFGFQLRHKLKLGEAVLLLKESVSLGEGRNVIVTDNGGLDFTGRIEFLPMGEFTDKGDYFSSDLKREGTAKLAIAVTADFNQGAIRQGGQLGKLLVDSSGAYIESDLTALFADLMFKYNGFSVLAEVAYRESSLGDFRDYNGRAFRQGFGYTCQAGYLLKSNYEIAGRYTRIMPLSGLASDIKHTEQITAGLSKYFMGHNLKVQTDLTYERALSTIFASDKLMFRLQTELSF
ncbi:MAG: FmdC precursor [Bacteroidetes bacterium]|nr:FmdC precursor [Bacteroidota bacterium]